MVRMVRMVVVIVLMMVSLAQSTELEAPTDLDSVSSRQGSSAQSQSQSVIRAATHTGLS